MNFTHKFYNIKRGYKEQATLKIYPQWLCFSWIYSEFKSSIFDEINDEESFPIGRDRKIVLDKLDHFFNSASTQQLFKIFIKQQS